MEIVNKVASSGLLVVDLKTLRPKGVRVEIDLADWLEEGLLLREKAFRELIAQHDWQKYANAYVNMVCSTDAIVPSWAYMLVASALQPFSKWVYVGTRAAMEQQLMLNAIESIEIEPYRDARVIINGCADPDIPETAFAQLTFKLQPIAKRNMYGEACSTVPVFKR